MSLGEKWIFHYVFIINLYFNCIIANPVKLWRCGLWTIVQSVFVNIPSVMWKMYILQSCCRSMRMPCIKCFIHAIQICIPYWFFGLLVLFITEMGVLEYFIVIIDLSVYPSVCPLVLYIYYKTISVHFCLHITSPHYKPSLPSRAAWCASSPGIMKHLLSPPFVILLPKRGHLVHPFHSPQSFFASGAPKGTLKCELLILIKTSSIESKAFVYH